MSGKISVQLWTPPKKPSNVVECYPETRGTTAPWQTVFGIHETKDAERPALPELKNVKKKK